MAHSSICKLCTFLIIAAATVCLAKAFAGEGVYRFGLDAMAGDLPIHSAPQGNSGATERTSWPELVGWNKMEAKAHLEQTTTKRIYLVPLGSVMTMEYSPGRVRVMYDEKDNVASVPRVG